MIRPVLSLAGNVCWFCAESEQFTTAFSNALLTLCWASNTSVSDIFQKAIGTQEGGFVINFAHGLFFKNYFYSSGSKCNIKYYKAMVHRYEGIVWWNWREKKYHQTFHQTSKEHIKWKHGGKNNMSCQLNFYRQKLWGFVILLFKIF